MTEPIVPPTHGLTDEALAALNLEPSQNGHVDIDSETADDPFPQMSSGDSIVFDAELLEDEPEGKEKPRERAPRGSRRASSRGEERDTAPGRAARDAKAGPPSLDEWLGFFSSVVLRLVVNWYLNYAFRGVDEDALSDREVERLAMTDEERQTIAVPFAELSHKSKFMRRHGRTIVASGDAFNAVIVLGMWMGRVNRIAARHRPKVQKGQANVNGSSGQSTPQGAGTPFGATGGRFPAGFEGPVWGPGTG